MALNQRAFTIIELVVVIAIIGILASVVLVNVVSYINKGKEAAIKAEMGQIRTVGIDFFASYGTYFGLFGTQTYLNIINGIMQAGGGVQNAASDTAFCTQVTYQEKTQCVDSTGYFGPAFSPSNCNTGNSSYSCQ